MFKRCRRCGAEDVPLTMSFFNTDMICMDCEEKEREHPDYEKAKEAESEAIKRGILNFKGIGRPEDL